MLELSPHTKMKFLRCKTYRGSTAEGDVFTTFSTSAPAAMHIFVSPCPNDVGQFTKNAVVPLSTNSKRRVAATTRMMFYCSNQLDGNDTVLLVWCVSAVKILLKREVMSKNWRTVAHRERTVLTWRYVSWFFDTFSTIQKTNQASKAPW